MKVSIQTLWSHINDLHITDSELSINSFKMVAVHTCKNIMEKFNKTYDDIFNIFIDKRIISVNKSIIEAEVLGDILNETQRIWEGKRSTDINYTLSCSTNLILKSINSGKVIKLDMYITDKCETEVDYCYTLGLLISIIVHNSYANSLYQQALEKAFPNQANSNFTTKSIKDFLN